VQLGLVALIWGASFMFIKVELDAGIAPVHVALLRCVFGAAALLAILAVTRERLPRGDARRGRGRACSSASSARWAPGWPRS
jgi:drug/metabolite transporter (DMT)-like permease